MARKRHRARGLYRILTLLAVKGLGKDASPINIRDLHLKQLSSPVHPMAVYPTMAACLELHYVVRHRRKLYFEGLDCEKKTWCYTITQAGEQYIMDFFQEVDAMRKLSSAFVAKPVKLRRVG